MHPLYQKASGLTKSIIGAAIEVHRDKGPGLVESIYEWCLIKELELRGLPTLSQKNVVIEYKGFTREDHSASIYWWKSASWLRQKRSKRSYPSTKPNSSVT